MYFKYTVMFGYERFETLFNPENQNIILNINSGNFGVADRFHSFALKSDLEWRQEKKFWM